MPSTGFLPHHKIWNQTIIQLVMSTKSMCVNINSLKVVDDKRKCKR